MLMYGIAWLLNDILDIDSSVWAGFFDRGRDPPDPRRDRRPHRQALRQGGPPAPDMAIEEAKETKETLGKTP